MNLRDAIQLTCHKLGILSLAIMVWCGTAKADDQKSAVTCSTLSGSVVHPLSSEPGGAAVVIFVTIDCPISNALLPEINRIHRHYSEKRVRLYLVYADPDLKRSDILTHGKEFEILPDVIFDENHKVVRACSATITPQAVVFTTGDTAVYRGRINNLYSDFGDRRAAVSDNTLRNVLDAILLGDEIPVSECEAIGCSIPALKTEADTELR